MTAEYVQDEIDLAPLNVIATPYCPLDGNPLRFLRRLTEGEPFGHPFPFKRSLEIEWGSCGHKSMVATLIVHEGKPVRLHAETVGSIWE